MKCKHLVCRSNKSNSSISIFIFYVIYYFIQLFFLQDVLTSTYLQSQFRKKQNVLYSFIHLRNEFHFSEVHDSMNRKGLMLTLLATHYALYRREPPQN